MSDEFNQWWSEVEKEHGHIRSPANRFSKKAWEKASDINLKLLYERDCHIEELEHEIERLNKFCKEFIYGEDNPKYYKTMDEKIAEKEARILELKETRDERNIERAFLIENNCLEERYSEASHYTWLDDKNEELEHKLEMAKESTEKLTKLLLLTIDIVNCEIGADYDRWMREVEQLK